MWLTAGIADAELSSVPPGAMQPDPVIFRDLAYVLVAAVLGATLAWLARQPLILGYVLGGVLIGPFTPGPAVSDVHTFEVVAEIGVVLLMFSIGIEFSLSDLLRVKWVALVGGPLGIVLSAALGLAIGGVLGWPPLQGLVVGLVMSVASTMVLARLLIDRGELHLRARPADRLDAARGRDRLSVWSPARGQRRARQPPRPPAVRL